MGWLTHYHRRLNYHSCEQVAWPSCLGMHLPSMRVPKPSSWLCVNGPAASITTSKVATSLPWRAFSAAYSSAWSRQASSLSILAGGSYSACTAGTLPRALELMASLATWSPQPPVQIPDAASTVSGGASAYSGTESLVGGTSPMSISSSTSSTSSSIGPSMGRHSSYTCATSWPRADQAVHLLGVHWPSTPQG